MSGNETEPILFNPESNRFTLVHLNIPLEQVTNILTFFRNILLPQIENTSPQLETIFNNPQDYKFRSINIRLKDLGKVLKQLEKTGTDYSPGDMNGIPLADTPSDTQTFLFGGGLERRLQIMKRQYQTGTPINEIDDLGTILPETVGLLLVYDNQDESIQLAPGANHRHIITSSDTFQERLVGVIVIHFD